MKAVKKMMRLNPIREVIKTVINEGIIIPCISSALILTQPLALSRLTEAEAAVINDSDAEFKL
jgi:hypothetical protein